ncbi:GntR family transcriptional regulator [Variovorax defluvii]|uniref:GntR family transcriptional regulator n=1 Tax=Variovorax defluvii TaxID=913761 RepID=A0ABP8I0S6_9BURK
MRDRFSPAPLTLTLPLQIADRMAEAIVDERFAPGERLKEVELAASFDVSRATIREALRILERRGLVVIVPQHGAQVAKLSRQELEDMFDIRVMLLGLASRTLARRITPEKERQLQAGLARLVAAKENADAYFHVSAEMALLVADLAGNALLSEQLRSFAQHIGRYARLGFITSARREQSLRNWRKLIKAIASGDDATAEALHRTMSQENRVAALAALDQRAAEEAVARESQAPAGPPSARRA